jgi:hypothetical protein
MGLYGERVVQSAWCHTGGQTSGLMTKQLLGLICPNLSEQHPKNMGLYGERVRAFGVVSHWRVLGHSWMHQCMTCRNMPGT